MFHPLVNTFTRVSANLHTRLGVMLFPCYWLFYAISFPAKKTLAKRKTCYPITNPKSLCNKHIISPNHRIEKLFFQISLYETEGLDDIIPGVCRLVLVRTSSPERAKSDAATGSMESLREVRFLVALSDPNICKVLGVCTAEQPPWTIIEYGEIGDLAQYLQFLVNRNGTVRSTNDQPMRLVLFAYQG